MNGGNVWTGRIAALAWLGFGAVPPAVSLQPVAGDGAEVRGFRWAGTLPGGGVVKVHNHYGDIRARGNEGDRVQLSAMIQRWGGRTAKPVVEVREDRGRIDIEVRYPAAPAPESIGRVDVTVLVPESAALQASTRGGGIQAKRIHSDVKADSEAGEISIATSGHAWAHSKQGRVSVTLKGGPWSRPMEVSSGSGPVRVQVPADADLALYATTAGEIATHLPAGGGIAAAENPGAIRIQLGSGGPDLRVHSTSGDIELKVTTPIGPGSAAARTPTVARRTDGPEVTP